MMSLQELIARLEKATEGSRELDCRIWLALFDKPVMTDPGGYGPRAHKPGYTPARQIWTDDWPYWNDSIQVRSVGDELDAPHFTTSIDDAMTLVPEGWRIRLRMYGRKNRCELEMASDMRRQAFGVQATAPLAICIAALKVRNT